MPPLQRKAPPSTNHTRTRPWCRASLRAALCLWLVGPFACRAPEQGDSAKSRNESESAAKAASNTEPATGKPRHGSKGTRSAPRRADKKTQQASVMEGPRHPQNRKAITWKSHDDSKLVYQMNPSETGYTLEVGENRPAGRIDVTEKAVILRDAKGEVVSQATVSPTGFEVFRGEKELVLRAKKRGSGYVVIAGSGRAIGRTRGNTMNLELPTIGGDQGAIPKPPPPRPGSPIVAEENNEPILEIWARSDRKRGELVVQRGDRNLVALDGKIPFKAAVMLGLVEELQEPERLAAFAFLVEFK